MLAQTLVLVAGLLALPAWSFRTNPPTTAPSETYTDCAAWVIAGPSENGEVLAADSQVSLLELLRLNPSLVANYSTVTGYSYCVLEGRGDEKLHNELAIRETETDMGRLVEYLFLSVVPQAVITALWNSRIQATVQFTSLSYADLADYIHRSAEGLALRARMKAAELREHIACNLKLLNDRVAKWKSGGSKTMDCLCYGFDCCRSDECPNMQLRRLARSPKPRRDIGSERDISARRDGSPDLAILPRASGEYLWSGTRNGVTYNGNFTAIAWPGPTAFDTNSWIWQNALVQGPEDDCTDLYVSTVTYNDIVAYVNRHPDLSIDAYDFVQVEHWVEKNMFAKFFTDLLNQVLPSGAAWQGAAAVPPSFLTTFMATSQPGLQGRLTVTGADNVLVPKTRLMHTLGSTRYTVNFMLLQANLNNMKEGLLKGDEIVARTKMGDAMAGLPRLFLTYLRQAFGVINYLNDATALDKGEVTLKAIRWELYTYQLLWAQAGNPLFDLVALWDEWYLNFMRERMQSARQWLLDWTLDGVEHYSGAPDNTAEKTAEDVCNFYYNRAFEMSGFNSLGYPTGIPTPP